MKRVTGSLNSTLKETLLLIIIITFPVLFPILRHNTNRRPSSDYSCSLWFLLSLILHLGKYVLLLSTWSHLESRSLAFESPQPTANCQGTQWVIDEDSIDDITFMKNRKMIRSLVHLLFLWNANSNLQSVSSPTPTFHKDRNCTKKQKISNPCWSYRVHIFPRAQLH